MTRGRIVVVASLFLAVVGFTLTRSQKPVPAQTSTTTVNVAVEQEALAKIDKEWAAAAQAKDVERTLHFWADDAVVLAPGEPALVGKAAIRAYVAKGFESADSAISWVTDRWTISSAGDMAYGVGSNSITFRDASGKLRTVPGKSATVWRKDAQGWKCVLDVWNDAPPASQ